IRATQSGGGGSRRVFNEFALATIVSMLPTSAPTASVRGMTRMSKRAIVITTVARLRRPPSLDCSHMRTGHVDVTIVVAHSAAERNGSATNPLKTIIATTNNTPSVLRVRSREE